MSDKIFSRVILAVTLIYSILFFSLSTFAYLNLDSMPMPSNDFVSILVAVAIGSGVLQFPAIVGLVVVFLFTEENN